METVEVDLTGGRPVDDVIVVRDALPLELPEGAEQQPDGSVLLTLAYPCTLKMKRAGEDVRETVYTELVLHRLKGADVRAILMAANGRAVQVAAARALRMRPSDAAVLLDRLDACDFTAVSETVNALLDIGTGMPDQVEEREGGYALPLRDAVQGPDGGALHELVFHRLTGQDLTEIGRAKETLPTAIARSTRIKLTALQPIFDEMDGADAMAANRVIGFLSRNGRRTGR